MSRSSRRSALGVCCALFAFMAIAASSAEAQKMTIWRINGANISTAKLSVSVQIQEFAGGGFNLLSKSGGTKVEVSCTAASLSGVQLAMEGTIGLSSQIRFTGCVTKLNGVTSAPCEPRLNTEKGVFITSLLKNSFTANESSGVYTFEPLSGETFATISPAEEKCPLGKSIPVLGGLALEGAVKTETATHVFSPSSVPALWLISKTEEHKATVDGSFVLALSGEHSGLGWRLLEVESNWRVGGAILTAKLSPGLSITEIEGGSETLLSKVAGVKVEKLCTGATLTGASLEAEGKLSSGAKIVFTGCIFKINGVEAPECQPHSKGREPGVVATNEAKGLLVLDATEVDLSIEPVTGETLVTVELGEECAIGEQVPLIGKLMLSLSQAGTEEATHLVLGSSLSELWLISKTAEHKVTLDGSAILQLSGEHAGLKWSGTVE